MFYSGNEEDPLGLAVKGRAREKRISDSLQGLNHVGGPLVDPNWDAFFQATQEQAGQKGTKFGYESAPHDDLSRDPAAVLSQLGGVPMAETFNTTSKQLGTPLHGLRMAIGR